MPINRLGIVPATDGTNNTTTEQVVGRISASLISSNNAANTINVRVWSHGYTAITPL